MRELRKLFLVGCMCGRAALIVALLIVWHGQTLAATQTINTITSIRTSSGPENLETFLANEDAQRFAHGFRSFVVSGGTGSTAGSLTHTISALIAYPAGYYVSVPSTTHAYTGGTRTFVYAHKDDTTTITDSDCTVTRSGHLVFVECDVGASTPTQPANTVTLMTVDTSAGAITAVTDTRVTSPVDVGTLSFPGYTYGALPASCSDGQTVRVTDGIRGLWRCRSNVWFRLEGLTINVQEFGARGNGTTDDTSAINAAIAAATVSSDDGINQSPGSGATIYFPAGIYRVTASITGRAYLTYRGDGWRNTVIRMDTSVAGNVPVVSCTDCRWSEWYGLSVETTAVAIGTSQDCFQFTRTSTFGNKIRMAHIATFRCYNSINISGDATNISVTDLYLRSPTNHGFFISSGSTSGRFETMYITGSGGRGFSGEGMNMSVINNIVTELTQGDGMRIAGDNLHLGGIYLGDSAAIANGSVPFFCYQCSNVLVDGMFINQGSTGASSAIMLDGTNNVQIRGLTRQGSCSRYLVEWQNSGNELPQLLQVGNHIGPITQSNSCTLGETNDRTYVAFRGIAGVAEGYTGNSITFPFYREQVHADHWAWRTINTPAMSTQAVTGYPRPDAQERWGFRREFPAVGNASPQNGSGPRYGFYSFNTDGFLGVLPATETVSTALVTGDSSTFSGGSIGSWTIQNGAACTALSDNAVAAHEDTRYLLLRCTGTGSASETFGGVRLNVAGLTAGKLYRLTWYQQPDSGAMSGEVNAVIFDSADATTLATGARGAATTNVWEARHLYAQATDGGLVLRFYIRDSVAGVIGLRIDTIELREVTSAGSLTLSGGRKANTTAGQHGGAYITVYGDDHASNAGQLLLASRTGVLLPSSTFASLGTPGDGTFFYCSDCTVANPCAGGGTGALAKRLNGSWRCN